ncbi:lipopolysaccharide export system protein LptC [Bibersteinia trehalosi]|nr:lipopolysaccharide export system protein LptC [Bibersteinia trehalosi]
MLFLAYKLGISPSMNRRLNLLLILITLGLASWAYYLYQENEQAGLSQLIKKDGEPEYTGNRMETMVYDDKGLPQYFASADEIKRYESNERTEFLKPLLELFGKETHLKQWKVSADSAEITKEKMLFLRGNVKIESLDKSSRLQQIETDAVTVDLTTQDIFSESVVKSTGLGFSSTGKGLTGNLKKQAATLLQDVKTYIEPTVIPNNSGRTEHKN